MTKRAQRQRVLVIEYIQQNFGVKAAKDFFFDTTAK